MDEPHRLLDQHFGLGMNPESLLTPKILQSYANRLLRETPSRCPMAPYHRPWGELMRVGEGGSSTVKADKDQFQVILDVQQFAPEEISVKVMDRYVVVEGKHEEKPDAHGWVSREFTRRYIIPEQCNIDEVTSKLSSDGVLSICVPRKEKITNNDERVINIEHTGKPAVQENPKSTKESTNNTNEES